MPGIHDNISAGMVMSEMSLASNFIPIYRDRMMAFEANFKSDGLKLRRKPILNAVRIRILNIKRAEKKVRLSGSIYF